MRAPDDPLALPGPLAHLAPKTKRNLGQIWGQFLGFLERRGELVPGKPPADRVTPGNVADWIALLRARQRAGSVVKCVIGLAIVLRAMDPSRDWGWIRRHKLRPRSAEVRASRKPIAPFDPGLLSERLFALCEELDARPATRRCAVDYRDAAIVLLGTYRPLRRSNLANLVVGESLVPVGERYRIDVPERQTKTCNPISVLVPRRVASILSRYIAHYRPILLGDREDKGQLWINREGHPKHPDAFWEIFQRIGKRVGVPGLRPHLVRHTAASVMLARNPMDLGTPSAALTHRGPRTINETYDRSGKEGALRIWARVRRKVSRGE